MQPTLLLPRRVGAQVRVTSSRLVLPYDEVLALSHAFRETSSNFGSQTDSMSPFLGLFRDNSDRQLSVGGTGRRWGIVMAAQSRGV